MDTLIDIGVLKECTPTSYNLDGHWITGMIEYSEWEHIRLCLGIPFYNELVLQVNTQTLTIDNQTFYDSFLKSCVAWFVLYESAFFIHTRAENKGVTQNTDDKSVEASGNTVGAYKKTALKHAESRREQMLKYLNDNKTLYPLFDTADTDCKQSGRCGYHYSLYFPKKSNY